VENKLTAGELGRPVTEVNPPMLDMKEDMRERLAAMRLLTNEAAERSELAVLEARIQIQHANEVLEAIATSRLARLPK
jgi:hypothetical protein